MMEGKIVERGHHRDLVQQTEGKYLNMLSFDQSQSRSSGGEKSTDAAPEEAVPQKRQDSVVNSNKDRRSPGEDATRKEAEDGQDMFTNEETDPEDAGWDVLLKYFRVT